MTREYDRYPEFRIEKNLTSVKRKNLLPKELQPKESLSLNKTTEKQPDDYVPLHLLKVIGEAAKVKRKTQEVARRALDIMDKSAESAGQPHVRVGGVDLRQGYRIDYREVNTSLRLQGQPVPFGNQIAEAHQDIKEPLTFSGTPEEFLAYAEALRQAMTQQPTGEANPQVGAADDFGLRVTGHLLPRFDEGLKFQYPKGGPEVEF